MLGLLRYGVPTSEKERLARSGELPGSPQADTEEAAEADRYAAGYLFGLNWPAASKFIQPMVDMVKTSDLPLFGGANPELQSWASHGVQQGRQAAGPRLPAGSAAEALVASMSSGEVGSRWRR
jgi:hypothetical protein